MQPLPPTPAIAGGLLIGLSASLLLLLTGRIAGVSGLAATVMRMAPAATPWKEAAAFIAGLPVGAALIAAFARAPKLTVTSSVPLLVIAGLLVGFGTRLGNGCTSGHGVCGIGRLSPRSLAATATFMGCAVLTVFLARHGVGG